MTKTDRNASRRSSHTSLTEGTIMEVSRPKSTVKALPLSIQSYLYSLRTSCVLQGPCLTTCLASAHWVWLSNTPCKSVSADVTLPIGPSLRKWQEATRTPPESFWCISLYGVMTNGAQLGNVRWTNPCMCLEKNPLSCIFSYAWFSKASFHLCLLQTTLLPCLFQQNTVYHNWLSKETMTSYFIYSSKYMGAF